MKDIGFHIANLLEHNECVIIPDFAGFVSNYKAASLHPVTHDIIPPSKRIAFNKNLINNDGLLINHISKENDWTYSVSSDWLKHQVEEFKKELDSGGIVFISSIGHIKKNTEGNLVFKQSNDNHLLQSFGLIDIKLQPILRKKTVESSSKVITESKAPFIPQETSSNRLINWIAACFVVLMLSTSLLLFVNENTQKATFLPDIIEDSLDKVREVIKDTQKQIFNPEVDTTKENLTTSIDNSTQIELDNTSIPVTTWIIIGSFKRKHKAKKALISAQNDGFETQILKGPNGFWRAGIQTDIPVENIQDTLLTFKKSYHKDAWVLED